MPKKGKFVTMDVTRHPLYTFRVEILEKNIIRVEAKEKKNYPQGDTFLVPNASKLARIGEGKAINETTFSLLTKEGRYVLTLTPGKEILVTLEGPKGLFYQAPLVLKNSGHLPAPSLTPDVFMLVDSPRYYLPNVPYGEGKGRKGGLKLHKDGFAFYLLLAHKDPFLLRESYRALTGATPLVPLSAFGVWDSRYFEYTDETVKEEVELYEKYNLPLDNFVIDTDWRKPGDDGAGYDLNVEDFPDLPSTFSYLHKKGIAVMFNDHPEPVMGARSLMDEKESTYRKENLTHYLSLGLDYWWYDRNWWTRLKVPGPFIRPETWGLYLYQDITEDYHKKMNPSSPKRSLMMGNVNEVTNGIWKGICDSASHRFGIQWTGDNWMRNSDLVQEFANMLRGGNDLITYINSDLSGHIGDGSENLYARWIQFGALSPIYRFHSTKGNKRYRQPWNYGELGLKVAKEYGTLRYRLLPLYYSLAHEAYEKGWPILRSLDYYDKSKKARRENMAALGENLYFGLVEHEDKMFAPSKASYPNGIHFTYYEGTELKGEPIFEETKEVCQFDWSKKCPIPGHGLEKYSAKITFDFVSPLEEKALLLLGSDDGIRVYMDGKLVDETWVNRGFAFDEIALVSPHEKHHFEVHYYQDAGGAGFSLMLRLLSEKEDKATSYLPKGAFYKDLFTGERKIGGKEYKDTYDPMRIPFYVKDWGIIPLYEEEKNIQNAENHTLIFELFMGEKEGKTSFTLYEDDGETLAYQKGEYRLTTYTFSYLNEKEAELTFGIPKGLFSGKRYCTSRHVKFRLHPLMGKKCVYCYDPGDGQVLPITYIPQEKDAFPLKGKGAAPDGDVYEMEADIPLTNVGEMRLRFKVE